MAHTPGPWSADYGDFAAYCETGAEVCEVTRGTHDDGSRIPDDEMEANLTLVAAAPELLAALRAVKSEFIDMYEECYPNDESDNDVTAAIDMVIAAIAKAEGRTDAQGHA